MDIKDLPLAKRVEVLEQLVCALARGILQHEFAKDLTRFNTQAVCEALANNGDHVQAIQLLAEWNPDFAVSVQTQ